MIAAIRERYGIVLDDTYVGAFKEVADKDGLDKGRVKKTGTFECELIRGHSVSTGAGTDDDFGFF